MKLASIGRRSDKAKVGLEGQFKMMTELEGIDLALGHVREKADGAGSGGGLLGSLRNLASNGVTALGNLSTAGTAFINPITIGLGALAAIISGPLLASLAPITLGFAAFAAIAIPEITKVWGAVSKGGKALKDLSPAERHLAGPIDSLKDQFGKLAKAVQPEILRGFGSALKIINKLMPVLKPLAEAAGKALDKFLKRIVNWLNSNSGKKFLNWLETDGPHAIKTFGNAMWILAQVVGRVFDFLKNAGDTWFRNVHRVFHDVRVAWDTLTHAFDTARHTIAHIFDDIKSTIGGAIDWVVGKIHILTGALSSINGALGGIPGKVLGSLGLAAGGISGAATGGIRSSMTLVGEHGPELVQLSAGSRVYNNSQTRGMLAQGGGGGGGHITLEITSDGGDTAAVLRELLRKHVRVHYRGDVNAALGS